MKNFVNRSLLEWICTENQLNSDVKLNWCLWFESDWVIINFL